MATKSKKNLSDNLISITTIENLDLNALTDKFQEKNVFVIVNNINNNKIDEINQKLDLLLKNLNKNESNDIKTKKKSKFIDENLIQELKEEFKNEPTPEELIKLMRK